MKSLPYYPSGFVRLFPILAAGYGTKTSGRNEPFIDRVCSFLAVLFYRQIIRQMGGHLMAMEIILYLTFITSASMTAQNRSIERFCCQ